MRCMLWAVKIGAISVGCDKPSEQSSTMAWRISAVDCQMDIYGSESLFPTEHLHNSLVTLNTGIVFIGKGTRIEVNEGNCSNAYTTVPHQTLLLCGDVELNPGPGPSSSQGGRNTRQTTLSISEGAVDLSDIMREFKDTRQQVNEKIDALGERMEERCTRLENDLESLRADITRTKEERDEVKQKLDDLENRSRRNNIVFHGI